MKVRTIPVKLTVDPDHDLAYLSLTSGDVSRGRSKWTERHEVIFDFDREGQLVGLELQSARGFDERLAARENLMEQLLRLKPEHQVDVMILMESLEDRTRREVLQTQARATTPPSLRWQLDADGCPWLVAAHCRAWLQRRPAHCDRGTWLAHVECLPGTHPADFQIDEADRWPRYYFDLDRAKAEIEAWLLKRNEVQ